MARQQAGHRMDRRALRAPRRTPAAAAAPAAAAPASSCPRPGGPTISRLWPPAAAISSARRARSCPRTSHEVGFARRRPAARGGGARGRARVGSLSTSTASRQRVGGQQREAVDHRGFGGVGRRQQQTREAALARQRPRPAARRASAASRRRATARRRSACRRWSASSRHRSAARTPSAIGRSNAVPALRTSAGARLTVMRCSGNSKPEFRIAARTRSRLSRTLASGRPTSTSAGRPNVTSTSTSTGMASTPNSAADRRRGQHGWTAWCKPRDSRAWRRFSGQIWRDVPTRGVAVRRNCDARWRPATCRNCDADYSSAGGVDREPLPGADAVRAQPVPLLERRDAGLEQPRDRRQRVAALDAIDLAAAARATRRAASRSTIVARSTSGRASAIGVGRSGCAASSTAGARGMIELLAGANARAHRQVVGLGQVGAVDAQLARDGRERLARPHGVPLQGAALGRRRPRPAARAAHRRCPAAPSARRPARAPASSSGAAPD